MVLFLVQYNCRPSSFWEEVENNNDYPVLDEAHRQMKTDKKKSETIKLQVHCKFCMTLASNNIISNQYSGRMF